MYMQVKFAQVRMVPYVCIFLPYMVKWYPCIEWNLSHTCLEIMTTNTHILRQLWEYGYYVQISRMNPYWSGRKLIQMFMFSVYQNCCAYSPFPYNEFLMRDIYARFMVCYFQNKRPSPVFGSLFSLLFGLPALCLIFLWGTSVPPSDREFPPPRKDHKRLWSF